MRTAIQLYTLREMEEPFTERIELVGETGFDGVEFAGLEGTAPGAVADALERADLSIAGAHVPYDRLAGGDLEALQTLGCETVVVSHLDETAFESVEAIERTADDLADLATRLEAGEVRLCYHNHAHEFVDVAGRSAFDRLVEATPPSVGLELDLGWAMAAGADPVELLDRLVDRVPMVHLKDVDRETRTPVELGRGGLDVEACVDAAHRADVEWLVYEHDRPTDPRDSLRHGARTLSDLA